MAEANAAVAKAEAANAQADLSSSEALIAHLKLEIEKLRREIYGTRSERKARLLIQERPASILATVTCVRPQKRYLKTMSEYRPLLFCACQELLVCREPTIDCFSEIKPSHS